MVGQGGEARGEGEGSRISPASAKLPFGDWGGGFLSGRDDALFVAMREKMCASDVEWRKLSPSGRGLRLLPTRTELREEMLFV